MLLGVALGGASLALLAWGAYRTFWTAHAIDVDETPADVPASANAAGGVSSARSEASLEQSRLVVQAIIRSLAENVDSLDASSAKFGQSLHGHRTGLEQGMSQSGIRNLERMLMSELQEMENANKHYRDQLEKANQKLKHQQEELDRLHADTDTDFLTKVANRRAFDRRIREELTRAKRYGKGFSLVMIDIDHFKRINDTHGHLAGDRILRALSRLMDELRRESDLLARYGGEEFVMLLPETGLENARLTAQALGNQIQRAVFRCDAHAVRVTVSLGVAEARPQTDTVEELIGRADAALYRAKENGRNRVEVATPGQ